MILELLAEAEASGAGLDWACGIIGVSLRTIQRWRSRPDGDDRRCRPRRALPNALSAAERARALAVLRDPRYAQLSPKQLVPLLADAGQYVGSESTLYRLQRQYGLRDTRFKLVNNLGKWELYDLVTDSQEATNLYQSALFEAVRAALQADVAGLKAGAKPGYFQ